MSQIQEVKGEKGVYDLKCLQLQAYTPVCLSFILISFIFIPTFIRPTTQDVNLESENNDDDDPQLGDVNLSGLSDDDPGSQAENEVPDPGPSLASIPDNSLGTFGCKNSAAN